MTLTVETRLNLTFFLKKAHVCAISKKEIKEKDLHHFCDTNVLDKFEDIRTKILRIFKNLPASTPVALNIK